MTRSFTTTRWSVIRAAAGSPSSEAREALTVLCEAYWEPLWVFARKLGYPVEEAHDLTQGYFTVLIDKDYVGDARPEAGRFRTFLLTSFKNFIANERNRARALKRGGGSRTLCIDSEPAEVRYRLEPLAKSTPESVFERRWALTVIERALQCLRRELEQAGKRDHFDRFKPYLVSGLGQRPYREIATEAGISEGAVRIVVHRLRRRLGELLRLEVCATVTREEQVDEELRYLLSVIAR